MEEKTMDLTERTQPVEEKGPDAENGLVPEAGSIKTGEGINTAAGGEGPAGGDAAEAEKAPAEGSRAGADPVSHKGSEGTRPSAAKISGAGKKKLGICLRRLRAGWNKMFGFFKRTAGRLRRFVQESSLLRRLVIALALVLAGTLVLSSGVPLVLGYHPISGAMELWFLCCFALLGLWGLSVLFRSDRVSRQIRAMAEGEEHPERYTRYVWGYHRKNVQDLKRIQEGVEAAVQRQMKSEHMKTELITNVSHDLKTPLTSIINYVDLLQKEGNTEEEKKEYLQVLARQSARMKKLVCDLIEVSKASTGNLEMASEDCELGIALSQALGEYEQRFEQRSLKVLQQLPGEEVHILADGRYLWRIFDNLLGNITKYAMGGTRVYVTLEKTEKQAVMIFRNISEAELAMTPDELMERFTRGDASRNTEGSGLGLSIADSLTRQMKGTMEVGLDGDLFKVTLTFPLLAP